MSYYRMRPPLVEQSYVGSCWAAALNSMSRVTPGVPTMNEDDLVDRFTTNEDGWIDGPGRRKLRRYLATCGMRMDRLRNLSLTGDIEDRLRKSHVVLVYRVDVSVWHAWVVYGIDNWIIYMDPIDKSLRKFYWRNKKLDDPKGYYLLWKP